MDIGYHRQKNVELHKLEEDRESVCLLMCGRFNSGKTSLLNMVLGLELPVKAVTATRAVTKISYDTEMSVDFRDGSNRRLSEEELEKYIAVGSENADGGEMEDVAAVHVPWKHLLLRKGKVEFWDTPGLEDDETLTEITMGAVRECDIAVFVMDADRFASRFEKELLAELQEFLGGNLIIVVNRMDLIREEERDRFVEHAKKMLKDFGNECCGAGQIIYTAAGSDYPDIGALFGRIYHICTNSQLLEQCRITAKTAKIETTAKRWGKELEGDIHQKQQDKKELMERYQEKFESLHEEIENTYRKDAERARDKLYQRIEEMDSTPEWKNALEKITTQKGWEKKYVMLSKNALEREVHNVYSSLQEIAEKELDRRAYSECYPLPSKPNSISWTNMDWGENFVLNEYKRRETIGGKIKRFLMGIFSVLLIIIGFGSCLMENVFGYLFGIATLIVSIISMMCSYGWIGRFKDEYVSQYKNDCISASLAALRRSLDASVKAPMKEYVEKILDSMQPALERKKQDAVASLKDQAVEIEKLGKVEDELIGYLKISREKSNLKQAGAEQ